MRTRAAWSSTAACSARACRAHRRLPRHHAHPRSSGATLAPAAHSDAAQSRRPASRALPAHDRSLERPVDPRLRDGVARGLPTGSRTRSSRNGYYEKPGVWVLEVDFDKRLVAEMLSAFAPARRAGAGLRRRGRAGVPPGSGRRGRGGRHQRDGARARVRARARRASTRATSSRWICPKKYDLLFGLDVFEHLNPNKLEAYLARLAAVTSDDAFLFCNIPAFGDDPVFGTVFPLYVDGWKDDAAAGKPFSRLHTDEQGYPIHGHLMWADAAWWSAQFERAGFTREVEIERAFHRKYDGYMEKRSPARRAFFVFGKPARRPAAPRCSPGSQTAFGACSRSAVLRPLLDVRSASVAVPICRRRRRMTSTRTSCGPCWRMTWLDCGDARRSSVHVPSSNVRRRSWSTCA